MALSKKDAKKAVALLAEYASDAQLKKMLEALKESGIKNKSFRKTIKRLGKALEPKKKSAVQKAA